MIVVTLREEIFAIQRKDLQISWEFNFVVEQYITKFFVPKSDFSIAFTDILKYNNSERTNLILRNLISRFRDSEIFRGI